jgi:hypothetical protein
MGVLGDIACESKSAARLATDMDSKKQMPDRIIYKSPILPVFAAAQ